MSDLKDFWDRAERRATYGILVMFVALELSSIVFPKISQFMNARGSLLLLAGSLLLLFRSIDKKISSVGTRDLSISTSFVHGFVSLLQERKNHEAIDIFTHTGLIYGRSLRESGSSIVKLRILVMDCRATSNMRFPKSDAERVELGVEFSRSMKELKLMQKEGRIGSIEVRAYLFEPMQHFALVDEHSAYFGFVIPQEDFPGLSSRQIPDTFTLSRVTSGGQIIIKQLNTMFNHIWSNLACEIDLSEYQ